MVADHQNMASELSTYDKFNLALGGAKAGRQNGELGFLPPPPSDALPIASLADFKRRMRPGVLVTYDALELDGAVRTRYENVQVRAEHQIPGCFMLKLPDREPLIGFHWPARRSDCQLDGPSLKDWGLGRYGWRITLIDESNAAPPPPPAPKKPRFPGPSDRSLNDVWDQLTEHRRDVNYRYFNSPGGPITGWTTQPDASWRYLSFIARQVGSGSRTGQSSQYELDRGSVSSHALRKDAKARADKLVTLAKAGQRI